MLTTLLSAVFGLTCLLHSSQAFFCTPVTFEDIYCDSDSLVPDKRFLIQGTVTGEGDLNREPGPLFGYVVYTVSVEYEYRDDENMINPGSSVTVVTRDEMLGGKYLYLGKTYVFAGKSQLMDGEKVLRTGDCEYHRKYDQPVDLTDILPSCEDENATTERRNENNPWPAGMGGGWR